MNEIEMEQVRRSEERRLNRDCKIPQKRWVVTLDKSYIRKTGKLGLKFDVKPKRR
jgi:hypothetical protein